jgi:hypothetical protein
MSKLAEATMAYQAQLEYARVAYEHLDDETLEDLQEDLDKARRDMEVAWLNEFMK